MIAIPGRILATLVGLCSAGTCVSAQLTQAWELAREGQPSRVLVAADGDVVLSASVLVPSTVSGAFYDSIIERYSPEGQLRWRWQSNESQDDRLRDIALDAQGNIYAVGTIGTSVWGQSPFATRLMKFSGTGQRLWTSVYTPGRSGLSTAPEGVRIAPDGTATIFGQDYGPVASTQKDIFIARYSSTGSHQWTYRRAGPAFDFVFDLTFDHSSNAYWVGSTFRAGTALLGGCLGKLNPSGQEQWLWLQPVGSNAGGWLSRISLDNAGDVVATGHVEYFPGYQDGLILKATQSGQELFSNIWDGPHARWDRFFTHAILSDNSIVVSGDTYVSDGWEYYDVPTIKYAAGGQLLWFDVFGSRLFAPNNTEEWSLNMFALPGDHVLTLSSDWSRPGHDYALSLFGADGRLVDRVEKHLANGDIKDIASGCAAHDPARHALYLLGWGSGFSSNPIADHYALVRVNIPDTTTRCLADFNRDGTATIQDMFDFLSDFFVGAQGADIDQSGGVTVQDLFDFLDAYFLGC